MQRIRICFSIGFIAIIFSIVLFRLYNLNILNHKYYLDILRSKKDKIITLSSAPRGRIIDTNGNILVDNIGIKNIVYTKNIGISPKEEIKIAAKLADIITLNYKESVRELKDYYLVTHQNECKKLITKKEYDKVQNRKLNSDDIYKLKIKRISDDKINSLTDKERLTAHIYSLMNKGYKYETKIIKSSDVSEEEYAKVIENNIEGVTGNISWERVYPYNETLKTILGSVSNNGIPKELKKEYLKKGYSLNDRVGISYLEKMYEDYLKGEKATYKVNSNNTLSLLTEEKRGNDLVLNIDINLQKKVEEVIREKIIAGKKLRNTEYYNHAYVIISDPNTGGILAIAGQQLQDNSLDFKDISINSITSAYTMGSVVKGASQTVGYQNNLIDVNKYITDSCVKLYYVPEKCSFKRLGKLNDITALKWSSNYYQFITAIKSTGKNYTYNMQLNTTSNDFKRYRDTFASYGLGVKTQIDLPNEKIGLIGAKQADDLLLNLSIGQYDTYTPIELVQYINTIANNGKRIKLSLMKKIVDKDNNVILENKNEVLNQVNMDEYYFQRIKEGFREVLDGGTGAGYTDLIYNPAGKTGTSESFYDSDNDGKADVKTISMSYAMFAPVDNPKYSLVAISPNVSHTNGSSDYMAYINKHISKEVSNYLFANY